MTVWFLLSVYTSSGLTAEIPLYIEAENADEITGELDVFDDDPNAWGKYIQVPEPGKGAGVPWDGKAYARYEIDVPGDAKLYIWGRIRAFDKKGNSFYFKLNDDTNLQEFLWHVPEEFADIPVGEQPEKFCPNWCWDPMTQPPGVEPFEFDFKKGKNDLYVVAREGLTGLDALYVVSDPAMQPPDRPIVVEPISKLAESWGRVKSVLWLSRRTGKEAVEK
jgi:hypothetical protein